MRVLANGRHLVAALACLALVAACASSPTEPGPPSASSRAVVGTCEPAASPQQASTPAPGASAPSSDAVFTQLPDFPTSDAFEITSVTWSSSGFVAAGFGPMPGEDYFGLRHGILWRSCDGLSWEQIVDPAFQHVSPTSVVAVGSDLFVVGDLATCSELDEDCADDGQAGNVVVRSSSGGAWERLGQPPDVRLAFLEGAAAVGDQLAVYGAADDENLSATLWLSRDGANWTRTTDLAGMDPITTLAPFGDGMLAFGGEYIDELEDAQLVGAISTDGARFTRVDAPPLLGGTVNSVVAAPVGYVGVGVGYPEDTELALKSFGLFSADGQSWTETDASDGSFDGSTLDRVHGLPSGYVAVGFAFDDIDFTVQTGHIWLSSDGRDWRLAGDYGTNVTDYETSALGPHGLIIFTADQQETDDGEVTSTIGAYHAPIDRLTP